MFYIYANDKLIYRPMDHSLSLLSPRLTLEIGKAGSFEMSVPPYHMSVPKSKRGESEMEFIYIARQLQMYTIRKCAGFPKKYTFYISQPLALDAKRIHDDVKMANSIFPTNAHEAQIRRDYLLRAHASLYSMVSQIEVAKELLGIDGRVVGYWMDLIVKEIGLIRAIMKNDQERFKKLT